MPRAFSYQYIKSSSLDLVVHLPKHDINLYLKHPNLIKHTAKTSIEREDMPIHERQDTNNLIDQTHERLGVNRCLAHAIILLKTNIKTSID